jgi:glutaconate CoA-transferase subunit B
VDFITSPGQRSHGLARRELGMPGAGPVKVITDKCVLTTDDASGELVLSALYPGVTVDDVRALVGWELREVPVLGCIDAPTDEELRLLREVLDPARLYLKGG